MNCQTNHLNPCKVMLSLVAFSYISNNELSLLLWGFERFTIGKADKSLELVKGMLTTLQPLGAEEASSPSLLAVQIYLVLMDGVLASDEEFEILDLGQSLVNWLDNYKRVYNRYTTKRDVYRYNPTLRIYSKSHTEEVYQLPDREIKVTQWMSHGCFL